MSVQVQNNKVILKERTTRKIVAPQFNQEVVDIANAYAEKAERVGPFAVLLLETLKEEHGICKNLLGSCRVCAVIALAEGK